jgi:hypothetical protein
MTTIKEFCSGNSSRWASVLPRSADVVKYINENLQRHSGATGVFADVNRQAFVSEYAFRLASVLWKSGGLALEAEDLKSKWARDEEVEASKYVSRLAGVSSGGYVLWPTDEKAVLSQARGILAFIHAEAKTEKLDRVVFWPGFRGCGVIAECQGDILIGETLWELKTTRYGYSSVNLRQVLCYATLDWLSGCYGFVRLGFFNPVLSRYFVSDIESLCQSCSALEAPYVFELIAGMMESVDRDGNVFDS